MKLKNYKPMNREGECGTDEVPVIWEEFIGNTSGEGDVLVPILTLMNEGYGSKRD